MIATITEEGVLVITPSNSLEAYAVQKWQEEYMLKKPRASLQINEDAPKYFELQIHGI